MAYGFQTDAFRSFDGFLRDYPEPEGLPQDRQVLSRAVELYLMAATALFELMRLISLSRLEQSNSGRRYIVFMNIYDHRVQALLQELADFLLGKLEQGDLESVHEFIEGVRRGAIAEELVLLQQATDESSGTGQDAEADTEGTTTAVNSLKEQIERRVKRKWIKDILHGINEVIAITRGAM
ncbi:MULTISPECIES: hypothetical protein [unclassified Ruegeria]|uniref:hypothetical protein n=1 Tax=unclassified Ruegeria TaxID=2625375 RepID=UPI001488C447|nr:MULTISPECIES: hypothetical protein [unclassified Ruegeria]